MKKQFNIFVDWCNIESIKSAERKKRRLENKGYILTETRSSLASDTATLVYTDNQ